MSYILQLKRYGTASDEYYAMPLKPSGYCCRCSSLTSSNFQAKAAVGIFADFDSDRSINLLEQLSDSDDDETVMVLPEPEDSAESEESEEMKKIKALLREAEEKNRALERESQQEKARIEKLEKSERQNLKFIQQQQHDQEAQGVAQRQSALDTLSATASQKNQKMVCYSTRLYLVLTFSCATHSHLSMYITFTPNAIACEV